jgi:hypothetical protein
MSYTQGIFIVFLLFVFLTGMYVTTLPSTNKVIETSIIKTEGMNNNAETCPDMLIQKGIALVLYNTKQPIVEGTNPIQFGSLDEYIRYLEIHRKSGVNCPVLYLQQESNAQGEDVYRMRPSPFDLQGGLPTNNAIVQQSVVTVSDANRLNAPYNANNYPGFDPNGQYVGIYTNIDQVHDMTKLVTISDNPMDPNWGGIKFTDNAIESGKYIENQVTKPLLYTPKTAFYPSVVDNQRGPVDVI